VNKRDIETINRKQVAAFKKTARELECDESEASFDKALRKVARTKPPKKSPKKRVSS
jgi:hypothetical protein